MVEISNLRFYRSGEVVRDIGIITLNNLIEEMNKEGHEVKSKLNSNVLEIENFEENDFIKFITKTKLNNGYFPYLRNSAKYGANSQKIENFHENFGKLISLTKNMNMKSFEEQGKLLDEYEPLDNICNVCHNNITALYDITHKEEKKERVNSKYNYSFMGCENSLFNNYGKCSNSVCFECEFLNLMYLLHINMMQPHFIIYTEDLKLMEFLNYKMLLEFKNLNQKSFYNKLSKYMNKKMRVYKIITDSKKGVILNLSNILEVNKLSLMIKYADCIDSFYFSKDSMKKKEICKGYIISRNYKSLENILINELLYIDDNEGKQLDNYKTSSNISLYLEILIMNNKGCDDMEESKVYTNGFESLGKALGTKIPEDSKKSILFKINQMMRCDDRQSLFETLVHLIAVNDLKMPNRFSYIIMKSPSNEMHYQLGRLMESFLGTKEEK
ncbi:hypothetical protein [Terrisporobacter sp.]